MIINTLEFLLSISNLVLCNQIIKSNFLNSSWRNITFSKTGTSIDRRTFLKTSAFITGMNLISNQRVFSKAQEPASFVLVKDGSPKQMADKVFELLGGVSRLISKGDYVMVKSKVSWDCRPEYTATTNPELVSAVVTQCFKAGAKKVLIVDNICNDARRSYKYCQIQKMASQAGADVRFVRKTHYN